MNRLRSATAAMLCALTLSACASQGATRVWLVIDSDLSREDADEIEIEVDGRAIGAARETRRVALGPETVLPMTLPITHAGGALGPIQVRVRARGDVDVEQRATFDFVLGRELELDMELAQICAEVRCGGDETCRGGTCAPRRVALIAAGAALRDGLTDAGPCEGFCRDAECLTVAPGLDPR